MQRDRYTHALISVLTHGGCLGRLFLAAGMKATGTSIDTLKVLNTVRTSLLEYIITGDNFWIF